MASKNDKLSNYKQPNPSINSPSGVPHVPRQGGSGSRGTVLTRREAAGWYPRVASLRESWDHNKYYYTSPRARYSHHAGSLSSTTIIKLYIILLSRHYCLYAQKNKLIKE